MSPLTAGESGLLRSSAKPLLIVGAGGYVGRHLQEQLTGKEQKIRCLVRRPPKVSQGNDIPCKRFVADVLEPESLQAPLEGVGCAYYLVHSMASGSRFETLERKGAENFAHAARKAGIQRIVYLGGLSDSEAGTSPHMRSRHRVGEILADSGIPVLELRASIIIGAGSLSFEMIRALVNRLPVMVMPRWVSVHAQPIYIDDVIDYLVEALDVAVGGHLVVEIGGRDQLSYRDLMREYARQRNLKRVMIPVPVLTPWLSSLWLGLVTPLFASVGRQLIESIRYPSIVRDERALRIFTVRPRGSSEAIRLALSQG